VANHDRALLKNVVSGTRRLRIRPRAALCSIGPASAELRVMERSPFVSTVHDLQGKKALSDNQLFDPAVHADRQTLLLAARR